MAQHVVDIVGTADSEDDSLRSASFSAPDGASMLAPADMTPAESAAYSQDYRDGYRQGRSDYPSGWFAIPADAPTGYADGYRRGYNWTRGRLGAPRKEG